MRVVKLAAGLAIGYVLGSRAGRDKYEQIVATVRKVNGQPGEAPADGLAGTATETITPTPSAVPPKPSAALPKPTAAPPKPTAAPPKPAAVTPEPVVAAPVVAEPVIAEPVIAEPVIAEPVVPAPDRESTAGAAVPRPPRRKPTVTPPDVPSSPLT